MNSNTGTSGNKWLFRHADTVKIILVWYSFNLKIAFSLSRTGGKVEVKRDPIQQKNISEGFSPLGRCISARKERQHQSLRLWFVCVFHHQCEDKNPFELLWDSSDPLMSWFSSLTWQGMTPYFFVWYLLCLFPRSRWRKTVGAWARGWNSSASVSSKIFRSACKILSCFSKVL